MLKNYFKKILAHDVASMQLEEAERMALEHEASAEHHDALAAMYRHRVERLREHLGHDKTAAGASEPFPTLLKSI